MRMPFGGYARVCYALGGRVKSLHGAVALDDIKAFFPAHPTCFVIYGDNNILWRSKSIEQGQIEKFTVDMSGVDVLELRIYSLRGGHSDARAIWLDPYVE